jgi:hypothetical protein
MAAVAKSLPKQFAALIGDKSLFEAAVAVKISGCY